MSHKAHNPAQLSPPSPPANPLLGSLQLLFWLFVHPTAWRDALRGIDPDLTADVALLDLRRRHWRDPRLRRVLLQALLLIPLLANLACGLTLWASGSPAVLIAAGLACGLVGGVLFGLTAGTILSLGVGMAGAAVVSVANNLVLLLAVRLAGVDPERLADTILATISRDIDACAAAIGVYSLALGLVCSSAFPLLADRWQPTVRRSPGAALARQLGAATVGLVVNVFALSMAVGLGAVIGGSIASGIGYGMVYGVAVFAAVGVRSYRWVLALALGATAFSLRMAAFETLSAIHVSPPGPLLNTMGGAAIGVISGVWSASYLALPSLIVRRVVGDRAGALAGVMGIGGICVGSSYMFVLYVGGSHFLWPFLPVALGGFLLGATQRWWRPVLAFPLLTAWNTLLYRADEQRDPALPPLFRRHSAFWDEDQPFALPRLDDHLVLVAERWPAEGAAAWSRSRAGRSAGRPRRPRSSWTRARWSAAPTSARSPGPTTSCRPAPWRGRRARCCAASAG